MDAASYLPPLALAFAAIAAVSCLCLRQLLIDMGLAGAAREVQEVSRDQRAGKRGEGAEIILFPKRHRGNRRV